MKKIFLGIILLLAFGLFLPMAAKAETNGLQISPVTFNYEIDPGDSISGKLLVTNRNEETLDYVLEVENFDQSSEEGVPTFTAVKPDSGLSTLANWVSFSEGTSGSIEAKKEKQINFTISTPAGAEPGGHYGAIFVKQVKAAGENQVAVAARVGALVLVSVPGDVTRGAMIIEFQAPKIVWKGPVDFKMRVQNTGSVHYDSKGTANIKNVLGANSEVDMGTHTIIPKSIRVYDAQWSKKYPIGYYKINPTATDGSGAIISGTAVVVWAIPLVIVIPILIILIILIWIIVYTKRHVRIVK